MYSKLVAVTGMPGLYELLNSKGDGAIVRSLEDNTTKFASSRIHNFSHLESIEIYTTADNVNLVEIFTAMEKAGGALPDGKDGGALKKYFEKVYPEIDFERVYSSDLKKMVKWFELLKKHKIEIKLSEPIEEEEPVEEAPVVKEPKVKAVKEPKTEKPAAKEEVKKAPAKEAKKEEKPEKKKAAPAKAAKKEKEEKPAKKKAAAKEVPKKKTPPKKK